MRLKILVPLALAALSYASAASADLIVEYPKEPCVNKKEGDACVVADGSKGTCNKVTDKRTPEGYIACTDLKPLLWSDLHPAPSAQPAKTESKGGCSVTGEGAEAWGLGALVGLAALGARRKRRSS